jgi:site-specific recombinase XerD
MSGKGVSVGKYTRYIENYCSLRLYLQHQQSSVTAARKDLYMFLRYLREHNLTRFNSATILDYMAWLRNERHNCSGSINRKISSLKMYIRHLSMREVPGAKDIPVSDIPRARDPYSGPVQVLEFNEIITIFKSIKTDTVIGLRNFTLFNLIYALGLRLGEALRISLEDIDLKKKLLTIHGKGRKTRHIPITKVIEKLLLDWLVARNALYNAEKCNALFVSKKGKALSPRMAEQAFKQIVSQHTGLSINKITPHSLRHAFASHAVDGNADLLVLKTIMGHASIKTTEIYIHPSILTLRKAISDHIASDILTELRRKRKGVFRIQARKSA